MDSRVNQLLSCLDLEVNANAEGSPRLVVEAVNFNAKLIQKVLHDSQSWVQHD